MRHPLGRSPAQLGERKVHADCVDVNVRRQRRRHLLEAVCAHVADRGVERIDHVEQPDAPRAIGKRDRMWHGVAGIERVEGERGRRFARLKPLSDDGELDVAFERFAVTLVVHEAAPLSHPKLSAQRRATQLRVRRASIDAGSDDDSVGFERRERVDA